ncbi:hypothetical protein B0I35DRAFT_241577 [Stachybotrys elegans]|uniref:Uncharacterized protein n=1 Tax=Stachybotrys elegans TaxID=80388 RepID=A0A8K0WR49_9HYPO|nr:hypothetical protein B0I35DRAFT_241577 [Stachybotrys elegans]
MRSHRLFPTDTRYPKLDSSQKHSVCSIPLLNILHGDPVALILRIFLHHVDRLRLALALILHLRILILVLHLVFMVRISFLPILGAFAAGLSLHLSFLPLLASVADLAVGKQNLLDVLHRAGSTRRAGVYLLQPFTRPPHLAVGAPADPLRVVAHIECLSSVLSRLSLIVCCKVVKLYVRDVGWIHVLAMIGFVLSSRKKKQLMFRLRCYSKTEIL